jgi:signal transduction histidine kinase
MELADLRPLFLFDGLTDDQVSELLSLGDEVRFTDGDVLFNEGAPAEFWWVLLEGRVELIRRSGREESVAGAMELPGVWAGGFLAWTDAAGYMATARGASVGAMLRVPSAALRQLALTWFPFGVHLIEGFFQTVRNMEAMSRQRAGLVALGTLAAGLAHELNNPASAAVRAADSLAESCELLLGSLVMLAQRSLSAEQFVQLDALRRSIDPTSPALDPLAVADREDELLDWLEGHGVDDAWRIAPPLASAGVDLEWCERVAEVLETNTIGPGIDWVAGTLATAALLSEVSEATGRVSTLVAAVKSYSQLDRASLQLIDVTEGIESTLLVLGQKLKAGITVVRDYAADLPSIEAMPSELNQVWTNLIDNAIDAMDGTGTLRISTRVDGESVIVQIADSGSGMPEEVQAHAFDPFFTTKDVGKGTGLGLDISHRIVVERHHGEITIESVPGETVMTVRLPRSHA